MEGPSHKVPRMGPSPPAMRPLHIFHSSDLPFLRLEMGKKAMTGKWLCELESVPSVGCPQRIHLHELWGLKEKGGSLPVTTPTGPGPQLLPPHLD